MRLIFWDWTGTLADESKLDEAVCRSMEHEYAERNGVPLKEAEKTFMHHLKRLEGTWQWHDYVLHGGFLGVDWKKHQEMNLDKLALLPYAKEILQRARENGYRNVMATNAVMPVILLRINYAGIAGLFDLIIASDDVRALKSEGRHLEHGLKALNGNAVLSFSIGDNPVQDILPAKRLGMKTIFCDFGKMTHYHSEHISENHSEPAKADYMIKRLKEIESVL